MGTPMTPGLYVRFRDGKVTINDEKVIELMLKHPGYNSDFVSVEETQRDPYQDFRSEIEPVHSLTEIKYGHVEKTVSSPHKRKLPPELERLIEARAMEMAKTLVPEMMNQIMERVKEQKGSAPAASETTAPDVEEIAQTETEQDSRESEAEKVEAILNPKKAKAKKPAKTETVDEGSEE